MIFFKHFYDSRWLLWWICSSLLNVRVNNDDPQRVTSVLAMEKKTPSNNFYLVYCITLSYTLKDLVYLGLFQDRRIWIFKFLAFFLKGEMTLISYVANKHIRTCPILGIIKEVQFRITVICFFISEWKDDEEW